MKDTKQKLSWIANYEAAFWNLPSTNWKASCEKKDYPPFWMTFAESNNFLGSLQEKKLTKTVK